MQDDLPVDGDDALSNATFRSGVAARLAGLPVETLRVWERRYSISDPQRSLHGQRLYTTAQIRRLGVIKRLVDQGHPVGTLAQLPTEQLLDLLMSASSGDVMARAPRVALIGEALVRRFIGYGQICPGLEVLFAHGDLNDATRALSESAIDLSLIDVLVVEIWELVENIVPAITKLRHATGAQAVLVMYRFCSSSTIRRLREAGCLVARVPSDPSEILMLCNAAIATESLAAPSNVNTVQLLNGDAVIQPRRLNELALETLIAASNRVACDCPRHLAEILLSIGSFERYSADCGVSNEADAALHQELYSAASRARTILEAAMEKLALAEGLPLPTMPVSA